MVRVNDCMKIVKISDTDICSSQFREAVQSAVHMLQRGGVIIYPTDTVYGIGVDATQALAMDRLFEIKHRNAEKPVSLLISDSTMVKNYAEIIPAYYSSLLKKYWPGPLTAVFKAKKDINPLLTGGKETIGFRVPNHPFCTALVQEYKKPITSTSANLSGEKECVDVSQISPEIINAVDLIIDGGEIAGGVSSTVVLCDDKFPKILREGAISRQEIEKFIKIKIQ